MTHDDARRPSFASRLRRTAMLLFGLLLGPLGTDAAFAVDNARAQSAAGVPRARNFSFDDVVRRAQDLAAHPFDANLPALPAGLGNLDQDKYRGIVFRKDKSFLTDRGAFALQLRHLGFVHKRPVVVDIVRDGMVNPIPYSAGLFEFSGVRFPRPLPINLGFAGLRILAPLQAPKQLSDAISFPGGATFQFLGRDSVYGLSARALAIKTGLAQPEEFPFFREIWVHQPARDADRIEIDALLDTPSAAGAFRFDVVPGRQTAVEVTMMVFARQNLDTIGLAPLSSMFFTGENDHRLMGSDFRPEVHDSDGVLLHNGNDEWVWRPLHNPVSTRRSQFFDVDPRGFGLMQRDRRFDHYFDLDARFEQRPSYWIEPQGKWGKGAVDLVELPASQADYDNVVLFWRPEAPIAAGDRIDLRYRISTVREADLHPLARTAATYETTKDADKTPNAAPSGARRFLVDFRGGDLAYYVTDPSPVKVDASTSTGRILVTSIVPNSHIQGLRVAVDVDVEPGRTADLRLILRASNGRPLSETWTYGWTSPSPPADTKAAGAPRSP